MNLLVTGGAGFIGSHFVRLALSARDSRPTSSSSRPPAPGPRPFLLTLDKLTYAGKRENLADLEGDPQHVFVQGNMGDVELVERLLREHHITAVAHFAAETHVDRSIAAPEPFFETNALGTARLLHACRRYCEGLPDDLRQSFRFLQVSTDEVYGSILPGAAAVKEDAPLAPSSPYAASKAAGELAARAYAHTYGLPVIVVRCSNAYGPGQFPEKLIPLIITKALAGEPLPIYGDGRNVRDWIYVEDLCQALLQVLRQGRVGEIYNIGGDCPMPNLELVDQLCKMLDQARPRPDGQSYASQKQFIADRPGHDFRYAIDSSKIHNELHWRPTTPLADGLWSIVKQWAAD